MYCGASENIVKVIVNAEQKQRALSTIFFAQPNFLKPEVKSISHTNFLGDCEMPITGEQSGCDSDVKKIGENTSKMNCLNTNQISSERRADETKPTDTSNLQKR